MPETSEDALRAEIAALRALVVRNLRDESRRLGRAGLPKAAVTRTLGNELTLRAAGTVGPSTTGWLRPKGPVHAGQWAW
jgi:hypothetical protein